MAFAITLHFLAAVVWVGGMFFALLILRPASLDLDLPTRVGLWARVLRRFVPVVWGAVLLLPATGYWMIGHALGGLAGAGHHVLIMQILGWTMILLFLLLFWRGFLPMRRMARELLIPEAGLYIERIRAIIQINLVLGIIVICVATAGRF
ncbi:MAG: hypothetical protein HQM02_08435 [Magnetococcales bacterium]|nr:hypothetical protein [Magnetococcales bacterium]